MNHIRTILMSVIALLVIVSSYAAIIDWNDIEIKEWVTNDAGEEQTGVAVDVQHSTGEAVIDQMTGDQVAIQSGFYHDYYYIPPTPTMTPTLVPTPTPMQGFDGKIISKQYTYTAPNPVRGHHANFTIYVKEACEIEVKVYTTTNRFVMSFSIDCPGEGKYQKQVYMGNLANGAYLFLVKAKVNGKEQERLIKKIALIK